VTDIEEHNQNLLWDSKSLLNVQLSDLLEERIVTYPVHKL